MSTAARIALRATGGAGAGGQTMKSSAIEELKTVLRRSLPLILGVILVGMVGLNLIRQVGGRRIARRRKCSWGMKTCSPPRSG